MINLWNKIGVPKKNWVGVSVHDLGKNNTQLCEMCGSKHIRFVHTMSHINYKQLECGCHCAENMSKDYVGRKTETLLRKKAAAEERLKYKNILRDARMLHNIIHRGIL